MKIYRWTWKPYHAHLWLIAMFMMLQPTQVQAAGTYHATASHSTSSQPPLYADAGIPAFWAMLHRMDKRLKRIHAEHSGMKHYVDRMLTPVCAELVPLTADGQALRMEARASADDPGLDFEVGASDSLDATNGTIGQTGNQNAFIGLRWDLLRSGLRANKGISKLLKTQASAADIRARIEYEDRLNQCRADKVHQGFLPLQATLLRMKVELLRNLWRLQLKSYLSGHSFFEDALAIEQELQVAGNDLARLQPELAEYPVNHAAAVISPPILDVNINTILAAVENDPRIKQLAVLDKEAIAQKKKNLDSARLLMSLRYEARGHAFKKHGPTGAIRYTQPLFERNEKGLSEREMGVEQRMGAVLTQRVRNTQQAYTTFNEERERTLRQWYRYQRVMERVRRSLKERRFDPATVDGAAAALRAMEVIDAAIELARAKELLYRRAGNIISRAGILYEPRFVQFGAVTNNSYRARAGGRALYLWSKTFNHYPNDFLMSFMQAKGINAVLLSAGKYMNKDKMRAFMIAARAAHLRVEIMFSDNDWLNPEHYQQALKRITKLSASKQFVNMDMELSRENKQQKHHRLALQSLGGHAMRIGAKAETDVIKPTQHQRLGAGMIHLDIEPQAVARYKGKPEKIQSVYLGLLSYLRQHLPKAMRLSVSLPVNWKPIDYKRISHLVDHVYIMDYGSAKPERIFKRLNAVRAAIPDYKLTLALRTPDFSSERALEQAFDIISQRTSIRHFAIHATGGYLKLTNRQASVAGQRIIHTSRRTR